MERGLRIWTPMASDGEMLANSNEDLVRMGIREPGAISHLRLAALSKPVWFRTSASVIFTCCVQKGTGLARRCPRQNRCTT
jgi:hypothetical protein